jgi:membrane protease YdiL (CAAX protease family)
MLFAMSLTASRVTFWNIGAKKKTINVNIKNTIKMKFLERALDGQNQWWKYILIFLLAYFGGQLIGSIPLMIVVAIKAYASNGLLTGISENFADLTTLGLSKNSVFGLTMLAPLTMLIFTVILIKALHNRTFFETASGRQSMRWNRVFFAFCFWFILMAIYGIVDYALHSDNYVLQFDLSKFAALLALSIALIPLQTTSEELLIRGYLAQGIGSRTKNRWLAWLIPSLIFGFMHIMNPEVAKFGFVLAMSQYLFFGLFFGLVAILDDGIELSIGMHTANNLFLSLFMTHSASALQTDALFSLKEINPAMELAVLIIVSSIAFVFFYKKYNWNWRIMNEKVIKYDLKFN